MLDECLDAVNMNQGATITKESGHVARFRTTARRCTSQRRQPPLLSFLVHPSVVLANLAPDANSGIVSIPFSTLKEGNFLKIFALDGYQVVRQSYAVPQASEGLEFQKRDLRFRSQLDYMKHYIGERSGIDLDPTLHGKSTNDTSVTLASNGSSSSAVRVINSVSQVYDLMLTLVADESQKDTLRKFGFITDWDRLSDEAKKEKYAKWNCHELHLFLYEKDREFFDTVVSPFLKVECVHQSER